MRYGSVCSGIEAATVAWAPLGWKAAWFSEIEKFPCAVLKHHYPNVSNLGDITKITEEQLHEHGPIDVLVGGTPCQSFSVAGFRGGMADPRGNLALRFIQLARATRARWVVWENVPGVLSSNKGRDFGSILGALAEVGYGFAYRILDAQYFRVSQRRRRVFVVGYLGDWRRSAAVLFERESLCGYPPPSREAGAGVAHCLARSTCSSHGRYDPNGEDFVVSPPIPILEAGARQGHRDTSRDGVGIGDEGDPMFTLQSSKHHAIAFSCKDHGQDAGDQSPTLRSMNNAGSKPNAGGQVAIAFNDDQSEQTRSMGESEEQSPTLRSGGSVSVATSKVVRRLTPTECEKLQGFSPGYTNIPYGRPKYPDQICPDGPRYKALGNSMAVPVMRWIGERIAMIETEPTKRKDSDGN